MRQSLKQMSSVLLILLIACPIYINSAKLSLSESSKSSILAQMSTQLSEMTEGAIDDALSLLELLASKTADELSDLTANFNTQEQSSKDTINSILDLIDTQSAQCDALTLQQNQLTNQISALNDEVDSDNAQIAANIDAIAAAEQQVCDSTLSYIADIKNQKDAISLFEALKQAVLDFQNNPSMVELKKFTQILLAIRSKAKGKNKQDQTDIHERTADEIGTGHIDDTPGEIAVGTLNSDALQDLSLVKSQLLDLIQQLSDNTQNYINDQIQKQQDFNDKMGNKIAFLKAENVKLQNEIEKDQALIVELSATLNDVQGQLAACQTALENLQESLAEQKDNLSALQNKYYQDSAQLQGQIDLFDQVIEMYKERVMSINESLKNRSEDYINNQNFENSQWGSEAAGYENDLTGRVSDYASESAAQNQ